MKWFNGAFTRSCKKISKVKAILNGMPNRELRGFVVFFLYASFQVNIVFKLHFLYTVKRKIIFFHLRCEALCVSCWHVRAKWTFGVEICCFVLRIAHSQTPKYYHQLYQ